MLDIVAEILPSGRKQWERVSSRLHEQGILHRAALPCIWHFNQLVNAEKSNGSAEVPCLVKRAKEIKDAIDRSEVIGHVKMNDTNSLCEANDDNDNKYLLGTNLADKNGKLRRPETNKQNVDNTVDVLHRAADQ